MDVLSVRNLTKKFGSFTAVDNLSFDLKKGEILGLLGPNGAGKTTTLQMLLGVLTPTNGKIKYFGKDFKKNREEITNQINFSSTYITLPYVLTVRENLNSIAYLYNIENRKQKIEQVLKDFDLLELAKNTVDTLSAGQVTRLNLAKSFLNDPKILLLDEPTASLDPEIANYIRKFILDYREKHDISIIFTSHNMGEVEEVCERVLFIDQGKIIADDTPMNLAKTINISHLEFGSENISAIENFAKQKNLAYRIEDKIISISVQEKEVAGLLQEIHNSGLSYQEINIIKPDLEDYFLSKIRRER